MSISEDIFRAYDIRGIVETALTPDAVTQIGQAFASEARAQNRDTVVIARDGRLSSPPVSPVDVGVEVAIEVSHTAADPITPGQLQNLARLVAGGPTQEPDHVLTGGGIAPQKIVGAVAAEVAGPAQVPLFSVSELARPLPGRQLVGFVLHRLVLGRPCLEVD